MLITQLYDEIYRALTSDDELMTLMNLKTSNLLKKAKHVQKRRQPQDIIENLPVITFYSPGGSKDKKNDLVFNSVFVFDVYTEDDVELAQDISTRINNIFDRKLSLFDGIENFESLFVDQSESLTDLANTYCFTTVLLFCISLDKD
jgi:hypothetical protein